MATQVIGKVKGDAGFSPIVSLEKADGVLTITVENEDGIVSESIATGEPVQSNWEVTDPDSAAYILNKPSLGKAAKTNSYADLDDKPTKLSQFTNDEGFITQSSVPSTLAELTGDTTHRTVTDAEKTEWSGKQDALTFNTTYNASSNKVATMSDVTTAISGVVQFDYEIVTELPAEGVKGKVYLKLNSGTGTNIYDEYIYVGGRFELIGTTQIDISGKADKATTLAGYGITDGYTKTEVDEKFTDLDVASTGGTDKYISAIEQEDGKIIPTASNIASTPTKSSRVPISCGGMYTAFGDSKGIRVITKAQYDALPETKLTDNVWYFISDM